MPRIVSSSQAAAFSVYPDGLLILSSSVRVETVSSVLNISICMDKFLFVHSLPSLSSDNKIPHLKYITIIRILKKSDRLPPITSDCLSIYPTLPQPLPGRVRAFSTVPLLLEYCPLQSRRTRIAG